MLEQMFYTMAERDVRTMSPAAGGAESVSHAVLHESFSMLRVRSHALVHRIVQRARVRIAWSLSSFSHEC